jgi:hypothetical protein
MQVVTESRRPYVLLGVIKERSDRRIAEYFVDNLVPQVAKALKGAQTALSDSESPLYTALLKICGTYKQASAYAESIFAYTETAVVLLDVRSGHLHAVHFGNGSQAPVILDSKGDICEPARRRRFHADNTYIQDDTYTILQGLHRVVLGSTGLWCAPCTHAA